MIDDTLSGRILFRLDDTLRTLRGGDGDLPGYVWKGASGIFAANAKGEVMIFLREPLRAKASFLTVEKPIIDFLRIARLRYF